PQALAIDSKDNLYVSDFSAHDIKKFDSTGKLLATIGEEGKDDGEFVQPSGLYIDADDNLYVCDTFNQPARIQKFNAKGKFLKSWSNSFFGPRGIGGDGKGRLYVVDTGNHKIQVFNDEGAFQKEWGGMGSGDGKFREPVGLTVDPQGFVYVADSDN